MVWIAMMAGNTGTLGKGTSLEESFQVVNHMQQHGSFIFRNLVYSLLQKCIKSKDLVVGRRVHFLIVSSGLASIAVLGDHLIRLFASCGSLLEANVVFSKFTKPGVYTWYAILSAHTNLGESERALELYYIMQQEGTKPNKFIFLCILKACSCIRAIAQGRNIHDEIVKTGCDLDVVIGNALINMYAKCGGLEEAHKVFKGLPNQDVVSWNAIIAGYVQHGLGLPALHLFASMQERAIKPTKVTLSCILNACGCVGAEVKGRQIHDEIITSGLVSDVIIGNTLIDMYAKCGSVEDARRVFDELAFPDIVSWGAMIAGYAQNGHALPAIVLFQYMQQKGITPSKVTILSILRACGNLMTISQGRLIHYQLVRSGLEVDVVIGNALIDMYAKCGSFEEAHIVFDALLNKDVVSWGALIVGYAQHGHGLPALGLFELMQGDGVEPDNAIYSSILKACGSIGVMKHGRLIHDQTVRKGIASDVVIGTSLVDLYARCGNLEEASNVFRELPDRNVVSWGTIIAAYSQHGNSMLAKQCFEEMQQQGLRPDSRIFASMLSGCSHTGQVDEGILLFNLMKEAHNIIPSIEHFSCLVDLLSRAGCLIEAEEFLQTMPFRPDITGWMCLLCGSKLYGNTELGRQSFDHLLGLDSNMSASYVLMTNIYNDSHMLGDASKTHELRKCSNAWKMPGKAWIEVNSMVQEFFVGSQTHPQSADIYAKLKRSARLTKKDELPPR